MSDVSDNPAYFGFTDLRGFKNFLVYVYAYAPDLFPHETWRKSDEQMNLQRAFAGLRYGLKLAADNMGNSQRMERCWQLVDEAYQEYLNKNERIGQQKLEEVEQLLKQFPTRSRR